MAPEWVVFTKDCERQRYVDAVVMDKVADLVTPLYVREVDKHWKHKDLDEMYGHRLGRATHVALQFFCQILPKLGLEEFLGGSATATAGTVFCLVGGDDDDMYGRLNKRLKDLPAPCIVFGLHIVAGGTARVLKWSRDSDGRVTRALCVQLLHLPSKTLGPVLRGMVSSVSSRVVEVEFIPPEEDDDQQRLFTRCGG